MSGPTREDVRRIVRRALRLRHEPGPHARLQADLGATPVDLVMLTTALEHEFTIDLEADELRALAARNGTVADLTGYVTRSWRMARNGGSAA